MATSLITVGGPPFLSNAGTPLNGGFVYFYEPGTSTPVTVYKDSGLSSAHAIPIVLDSYGWPPENAIWTSAQVDMEIKTSAGVSLRTIDNVNTSTAAASLNTVASKSDDYVIVVADDSKTIAQTAAAKTFSTTDNAATFGNGFSVYIQNRSTGILTFDPQGSETVNDGETTATTLVLRPYYSARLVCDGTNWTAIVTPIWSDVVNSNLLINGGFQVAQLGNGPFTNLTTTVNNDDTHLFDQWVFLAEAADTCDVSRITTAAVKDDASAYAIDFDVETSNKKFGFMQMLDSNRTAGLFKNGTGIVSLSFTVCQAGGGATKFKAAVLAWTGTADSVTSDIVSAWGAEGTTPTWIANLTLESTITELTLTTSVQRFEIENIALDTASTNNLMVFLWTDDLTMTAGTDHVYLSGVKLEHGPVCTEYRERLYSDDLYDAHAFFWRTTRVSTSDPIGSGVCNGTASALVTIQFPRAMRVAPSLATSNDADFVVSAGSATDFNTTAIAGTRITTEKALVTATSASALTDGNGCILLFDATANGFLEFSARL